MPESSFRFKISTVRPTVAVFADEFLTKPIVKILKSKDLAIKRSGLVDYVIDCLGSPQAVSLAKESNAKFLRVIIGEQSLPSLGHLNWRVIKTDFLIGPVMPKNTFLNKILSAAIANETITLPPSESLIYPLSVDDLAKAIWQSLVLPETNGEEFLILGRAVTLESLASFVQQLGQTTKGVHFSPTELIPGYSAEKIKQSRQALDWQPQIDWQEDLEKAFHSAWKNYKPEKTNPDFEIAVQKISSPEKEINVKKVKVKKITPKAPVLDEEPDKKEEYQENYFVHETEEKAKETNEKIEKILVQFDKKGPERMSPSSLNRLSWKYIFILFSIISALTFITTWIKPLTNIALGFLYLKKTQEFLYSQSWQESKRNAEIAKGKFVAAENFVKNSRLKILLLGTDSTLGKIAEVGKKTSFTVESIVPFSEEMLSLVEAILHGKEFDFIREIPRIQTQRAEISSQLSVIEALLNSSWPKLPRRWQNLPKKTAEKIKEARTLLDKSGKLIGGLDWLVGSNNQRRTFLILFQNNMELRPTGGFIGSFALLSFEDGSLVNFEVKDIYSADGQLKGHVDPPKQIKEILGEKNWYLRDANWNPDFPKSARNIEWFLEKELGRTVDGVIGFDLEAAKKLVGAMGEITLPDFNEKINSGNLFERAEFWSENQFFPGSNQKMAFLGLLAKQLFENIKAAKAEDYLKITKSILTALDEKSILLFVHDEKLAEKMRQLNWDGGIKNVQCNLPDCFNDYLFLVEANLGINKTNYFLKRGVEHSVDIQKNGIISHLVKINYENSATSNNWPGGDYVNWLRVYLPKESKIEEIIILDPLDPKNQEIIDIKSREEEVKDEKEIVGFLVRVPVNQRRTVSLKYSQESSDKGSNYFLYWQKQPGYTSTPISLLISFPSGWQPIQVNPAATLVSDKLLFNQQLDKDLSFGAEFGK